MQTRALSSEEVVLVLPVSLAGLDLRMEKDTETLKGMHCLMRDDGPEHLGNVFGIMAQYGIIPDLAFGGSQDEIKTRIALGEGYAIAPISVASLDMCPELTVAHFEGRDSDEKFCLELVAFWAESNSNEAADKFLDMFE